MRALLWCCLLAWTCSPAWGLETVDISRAEVSHDGGVSWQTVSLPDNWAQRLAQRQSAGRYRLAFELVGAQAEPLALAFERLGTHRRVLLNGQLLQQQGDGPGYSTRRGAAPALLTLPAAMLRSGTNLVSIELRHLGNGGFPVVQLGSLEQMRLQHARWHWRDVATPQALNLASLGLALFMLTVWAARRSEAALGCFGALALLTALRNLAYFSTVVPGPAGVLDWFFYASQVFTAVLLGLFALAMTGPWPAYRRWLWALAATLPVVALVAAWQDHAGAASQALPEVGSTAMAWLRRWTYPLLMLATLPALWAMARLARRRPGGKVALLGLGVLALVAGGVHDYAAQVGALPFTRGYLLPYVFPLALGAMSLYLVGRMVRATGAAESLALELDERVALRTRELAEANAVKSRFLGNASHDLRQPVLTVGLLASLLHEQVAATAAFRSLLPLSYRLRAASASMESLLNGLMDLSRLDSPATRLRLEPVPLQVLFDAIAHHEQASADSRGLRLRFRPTLLVAGTDPLLLEQALRNLVGNALRYTQRGGVLVAARRSGAGQLRLQVWDTGIGIAAADQQRVFEAFVQLNNPGRDRRLGLGLGLAIVQSNVRALGVAMTLRSEPGRGSCFTLQLPLTHSPAPLAGVRGAEPERSPSFEAPGPSIWLIEDDDELRAALALRLQAWGASVLALGSAGEALRLLDRLAQRQVDAPDLLITDQRLGDGLGTEIIARARRLVADSLPCVLMTGEQDAHAPSPPAPLGPQLLHKPFAMSVLRAAVDQALEAMPRDDPR